MSDENLDKAVDCTLPREMVGTLPVEEMNTTELRMNRNVDPTAAKIELTRRGEPGYGPYIGPGSHYHKKRYPMHINS